MAFLFGFNPLLGGAATLFLGTLLIWQLQKKTGLATEAMIGVVFAGSLAIGAALTPQEDLVEALFGRFQPLSLFAFLLGIVAVLLIIFVIYRFKEELLLSLFSPELAAATSVRSEPAQSLFPADVQPDGTCGTALYGGAACRRSGHHPRDHRPPIGEQCFSFPLCFLPG